MRGAIRQPRRMKRITLTAFGDSLTQGIGDECALGWVGRLSARLSARFDVTTYNLGIRGNTSLDLSRRVQHEAKSRLEVDAHNIITVCIGTNDSASYRGKLRVPVGRSVQLVKRILDCVKPYGHVLLISPPPVVEEAVEFEPSDGDRFTFRRSVLLQLNDAYGELAEQLGIPYLDLLSDPESLREPLRETSDGIHPKARGYEALADRIEAWPAWELAVRDESPRKKSTLSLGTPEARS